jgi:hypothetical protein
MRRIAATAGLLAISLMVTGCARTSISEIMGSSDPQPQSAAPIIQANQDLSMPPDLQLRAPGTAAPPSVPEAQVASAPAAASTTAAAEPQGDVYERNGISKVHPDGTPKTDAQLKAELKKVYLAKKQQANPKYGTVFNIGNIFKDE